MSEDNYRGPPKPGKLICIEGIDASGKTVQTNLLHMKLVTSIGGIVWSFPNYANKTGEFIKTILNGKISYHSHTWACLMAANRYEDKLFIESALRCTNVICNRYKYSNLVYSTASGIRSEWLFELDDEMPDADMVIVIDIEPKTSIDRKKDRDTLESDLEYLKKVQSTYLEMANTHEWYVIDGTRAPQDVHRDICDLVNEKFGWSITT